MTSEPENTKKNFLEWTVFALSTILILATFAYMISAAIRSENGPPCLRVEMGKAVVENGWVRIPVTVTNDGQSVAAGVEIRVFAESGTDQREGGFTLDFVPRSGTRMGSVAFKGTQIPDHLDCELIGYEEP